MRWTEPAENAVERQAAYIAQDSPRYASVLVREVRDAARSLRQFPKRGRIVPEENDPALRELIVAKSYRMLYQVLDDRREVWIVAFVHGARLLENALDEEDYLS